MKRFLVIACFSLAYWFPVFGQTTFIPDTNFRKCLTRFLTPDSLLRNDLAASADTLSCSNLKIINLAGIEQFKNLTVLRCDNNKISHLSPIENMTRLKELSCQNNPLQVFPSLSKMTGLTLLQCSNTNLTETLDLSANTSLSQLNCSSNKLTEIRGLSKLTALTYLNCANNWLEALQGLSELTQLVQLVSTSNKIKALPSLDKLQSLKALYIEYNALTTLPDLSNLRSLTDLKASNNAIQHLPKFSPNNRITTIHLDNNQLDSVPTLNMLRVVESIQLGNNKLTKIPDLSFCTKTLRSLYVMNNKLDALPGISSDFPLLSSVQVEHNKLSFYDLTPLLEKTTLGSFKYAPQDSIGVKQFVAHFQGSSLDLVVDDPAPANSNYVWYRNGKYHDSTSQGFLHIDQLTAKEVGTYTCIATNTTFSDKNLKQIFQPITLSIASCFDIALLKMETSPIECNIGARISLDLKSIQGGTPPFAIRLTGKSTNNEYPINGNLFSNLFEKEYRLQIKDAAGCTKYKDLIVDGKNPDDCETLVIVADNSLSSNSSLFLEDKGTAKVYDKEGTLVKTFATPATWDGSLNTGQYIPGFYMVELNDKFYRVTVIK